ncbi:MAG: efflux RND transporter permease subunit, partial [Betaproteobacteria bacterium]|nr:efflux RND transporter permease subunit [Betaproteobacteria bacterium]
MQAIKARYLIMIGAVILMMAGLNTAQKTPMDVFPEFAPVKVEVQTEGPGLSSIEIEQLISIPIERAFSGIPNVKTIRSKSVLGLSSVVLLFAEGAEMAEARQAVQERLLIVSSTLPKFVKQPTMMPPLSSLSRILKIGLSSDSHSIEQLSTSALWTIRPRLMAITGVANVALWGLRDPELHVKFDTRKLTQHNLTSLQVSQQLSAFITPNAGGYLDTAQQRFAITQDSPSTDITAYEQLTVGYNNGISIKLNQVADVVWGHAIAIGDAVINQGDGLLLIVEKTPGANTLSVTKDIDAALEELKPALSGITVDASIFRPATFIEKAVQNLQHALWLGAGLVVMILFIFLRNPKAAAISLISIPLSLTTAILLLTWLTVSVNTMVLAGLVIALGEVVDDSIIDLENILRAIHENRLLQQPKALIKVIAQASYEVRGAVLNATLIVMAVFMPIFCLEGIAGAFFKPLAYG